MIRALLRAAVPALLLAAPAFLVGCGPDRVAGGSGSQTTNTVTGAVVDEGGRPQGGVAVRLVPAAYLPLAGRAFPDSLADTTDGRGRYAFRDLPAGRYALEARQPGSGTALLVFGLEVSGEDDLPRVRDTLRATGSLTVSLAARTLLTGGTLYIPGTPYGVPVDSAALARGSIRLDSLPAARYPGLRYIEDTSLAGFPGEVSGPFAVAPGRDSALGPYAAWKAAWKVSLASPDPEAGPPEALRGFPLYLRLDAANFDFAAARGDGRDLRITSADGSAAVPYEIERWDSAGRRADLWIRLDSVSVPEGAAELRLYAGNAAAGPDTPGRPVFDSAAGFAGVWHLADAVPGPDTALAFPDATVHGNAGLARNGAGRGPVPGPTGPAQAFDGVDDHLDLGDSPAFDVGARMTLEAWVRPDRLPDSGAVFRDALVAAKFDAYSLGLQWDGRLEAWLRTGPELTPYIAFAPPGSVAPGGWRHVAAAYDGTAWRIYLDGRPAASIPASGAVSRSARPLYIGYIEGWPGYSRFFAGAIDEVRLSRTDRSRGWIGLSFRTQAEGNKTVTLERLAR